MMVIDYSFHIHVYKVNNIWKAYAYIEGFGNDDNQTFNVESPLSDACFAIYKMANSIEEWEIKNNQNKNHSI